ncbi:chemotaxis protein CheX [Parathalassolituus penaei]|uniref:Chemotaxis protein CheX n=1 Tax=Parathalassolituus penaei TaxID=2997323 RepID=A0A9X3EFQ3_9GAMM|nr:chemotaxis protein CheX [Parathalassolituus penaei]MCY0966674.1 chemotaxis protein CheX [Parathalassolituus penaei]
MNVVFINAFVESINNILVTMASMSCEYQKPYIKQDQQPLGVVTGMIPMAGDNVKGSLAISFSEGAILKISSKMLGEEITSLEDGCTDLTGEITNMLSGGARKILWEKGYDFDMAQPHLLTGTQMIEHEVTGPVMVIPFVTRSGPFFIEAVFASRLNRAKSIV